MDGGIRAERAACPHRGHRADRPPVGFTPQTARISRGDTPPASGASQQELRSGTLTKRTSPTGSKRSGLQPEQHWQQEGDNLWWIPAGTPVVVNFITIPDGMVYVGQTPSTKEPPPNSHSSTPRCPSVGLPTSTPPCRGVPPCSPTVSSSPQPEPPTCAG